MKIAVLGGGNGSYAAVADFTEAGHDVHWWRRGGSGPPEISLTDHQGSRAVPTRVTSDLESVIKRADLIFVPVPAFAQSEIADVLAPHLGDGQVVLLAPGSFGSLTMAQAVRAAGNNTDFVFAETATLPWIARKTDDDRLIVTTRANRLPLGAYPASQTDRARSVVASAFPDVSWIPVEDALSAALLNCGPILHPPLVFMNAGAIEAQDSFEIHAEGTQPAIRLVQDALDAERIAVRTALGYDSPHFPLRDFYESDQWMYGKLGQDLPTDQPPPHEKIDFRGHRYISEDIAIGLAFMVSLGSWLGVPTPLASAFLEIASAATGQELANGPRTATTTALVQMSPEELRRNLRDASMPIG
ncbi:NAD/NADP-dependent octopine/nopaline dehydrogenase family protein [Shimia sediminis]|uniref:NAD/NADP-dependent octopine/nopaline dehydrogenase family protein n=1 Tax=Shimia sediminis TaxID=2497945 RepID=UPI000F8F6FDC|nr:NAD/NADP-dependent octopine/nopaline dehydrogenase family protein [Shimia sediminis]